MPFSLCLIVAVVIQLGCQLFKVVFYSLRDRRLSFRWFFSAGGMPSAHTAFVTALAVSLGLRSGFDSEVFAVAFVLASIVVYDILRVRAAVQTHSNILRVLLAERSTRVTGSTASGAAGRGRVEIPALPSEVGHSLAEVVVGFLVGALGAAGAVGAWGALEAAGILGSGWPPG